MLTSGVRSPSKSATLDVPQEVNESFVFATSSDPMQLSTLHPNQYMHQLKQLSPQAGSGMYPHMLVPSSPAAHYGQPRLPSPPR